MIILENISDNCISRLLARNEPGGYSWPNFHHPRTGVSALSSTQSMELTPVVVIRGYSATTNTMNPDQKTPTTLTRDVSATVVDKARKAFCIFIPSFILNEEQASISTSSRLAMH